MHYIHHMPQCLSWHKTILGITGWTYYFHEYICVIHILFLWDCILCVSQIYIKPWISYISHSLCDLPNFKKSSLGQTLIKVKHKVKWMVKCFQNMKFTFLHPPPLPLLPSTYLKQLGKIRLHMVLTLFVNSLTKFVRTNQNLTVLKKCPIFFIPTASTNIKTHRAKY